VAAVRLRRWPWALAAGAACLVLAIAYLPPRGATASRRSSFFTAQSPRGTPARLRVQALADEWRVADGALRLLRVRHEIRTRMRRGPGTGPLIVYTDSTAVSPVSAGIIDSAMQKAWRDVGLGETKIRIAVVLALSRMAGAGEPVPEQEEVAYLAPDSTDRTSCVALVPAGPYWTRAIRGELGRRFSFDQLVESFKAGLGACAFYAAYGTPGRPVRRWLVARNWDLALSLNEHASQTLAAAWLRDPRFGWYWEAVYALPPATVGCLAGRPDACRTAVFRGASAEFEIPVPDIARTERRWWRPQHLIGARRYLGDVARSVGRDRFLTFWNSSLPVDTALALALKEPVGHWTARWQRTFAPRVRLGPAAPLGASAMGIILAGVAFAVVAIWSSRRQVQ
jgi:hypothetical protein